MFSQLRAQIQKGRGGAGHLCTGNRRQQAHVGKPGMRPTSRDWVPVAKRNPPKARCVQVWQLRHPRPPIVGLIGVDGPFFGCDGRSEARRYWILVSSCGSVLFAGWSRSVAVIIPSSSRDIAQRLHATKSRPFTETTQLNFFIFIFIFFKIHSCFEINKIAEWGKKNLMNLKIPSVFSPCLKTWFAVFGRQTR